MKFMKLASSGYSRRNGLATPQSAKTAVSQLFHACMVAA